MTARVGTSSQTRRRPEIWHTFWRTVDRLTPDMSPHLPKTVYHAKAGRRHIQAVLGLELIPIAPNSPTFTLLLHGQPLAKAEVTVFAPPKWQKSFRTDDQGRVTLHTPWVGRYVVEVVHLEDKACDAWGEAYHRLRHVSRLSFVAEEGIAWTAP